MTDRCVSIRGVVELRIPPEWVVRKDDESNSVIICPLEYGNCELRFVMNAFMVRENYTSINWEIFSENLMKARNPQGNPNRETDSLANVSCAMYNWSDGICDIITWFVQFDPNCVIELSYWKDRGPDEQWDAWMDMPKFITTNMRWTIERKK